MAPSPGPAASPKPARARSTLTAGNTHAGGTTVTGGTLIVDRLGNAGQAGPVGTGGVTLNGGGLRFEIAGNGYAASDRGLTVGPGGGSISTQFLDGFGLSGDITSVGSGDRTLTVDLAGASNTNSTLAGAITESGTGRLALIKTGAARLFIGDDNTTSTYSGNTVIDQGALYLDFGLGNATPIPFGFNKGNVVLNQGGTLGLLDNNLQINGLSDGPDGGGFVGQFVTNRNRTLTMGHGDAFASFSGTIDGPGLALTKVGAGTQTLTGPNTYARATTLSGGTLPNQLPRQRRPGQRHRRVIERRRQPRARRRHPPLQLHLHRPPRHRP